MSNLWYKVEKDLHTLGGSPEYRNNFIKRGALIKVEKRDNNLNEFVVSIKEGNSFKSVIVDIDEYYNSINIRNPIDNSSLVSQLNELIDWEGNKNDAKKMKIGIKVKILHGKFKGKVGTVVDFYDTEPDLEAEIYVKTSDGKIRYLGKEDIEFVK